MYRQARCNAHCDARCKRRCVWLGAIIAMLTCAWSSSQSFAVILYRSPARNTTAPGGVYANSGWQLEGQFGGVLGTPVAPNWFITALHPGGTNSITFNGVTYNIDQTFVGDGAGWINGPNSDLRLWKIQGTFPTWAPMWDASVDGSEIDHELVAIGRGAPRGAPVYGMAAAPRDGVVSPGSRVPVTEHKGWLWDDYDGVQSWGANFVDGIFDATPFNLGQLLTFDFDRLSPLSEECALANGDSGGAVFIKSVVTGTWKLAGIHFSVDGPWRQRPSSENFLGSMFDAGGLYIADNPPIFVPDQATDVPGTSYSSRISSNLAWIRSVIGPTIDPPAVPEPTTLVLASVALAAVIARRRRMLWT